jgi:hypothetical protein
VKNRALLILLAILAVAVALENFIFFSRSGDDLSWDDGEIEEALESQATSTESEVLPAVERPRLVAWLREQPGPGRSPFLTRAEAERLGESPALALPQLSATLWSADRRVAWIDGSPRSEGDLVGDHEVESIEPKAVVLRRGDTRVRVEMAWVEEPLPPREWDDDVD